MELQRVQEAEEIVNDDRIQEMLALAARFKEQSGGDLDDEAIDAVAEATGAPVEYVRVALRGLAEKRKESLFERVKHAYLSFDSRMRRFAIASILGIGVAIAAATGHLIADDTGLFGAVGAILCMGAVWNSIQAKDTKTAALSGGLFAGVSFLGYTLFGFVGQLLPGLNDLHAPGWTIILWAILGAAVGGVAKAIAVSNARRLGLRDPSTQRYELLQQLLEIQDKLKAEEQFASYLSIDIVGSTRMKQDNDPISIEYTFTEYHKFIDAVATRFNGRIHSTAGDGVICAFDDPAKALGAGRAILGGLFEFNSFRNRTKNPLEIRAGLHTGNVSAPGREIGKVEFAHVIDIAAHLQKEADPGTLAVSEVTATFIEGGLQAISKTCIHVQGVQAAIWRPKAQMQKALKA